MNEYELLRAEFIHNNESIVQYENMMYASVAAILAFAAQAGNYILCLASYVIIIPCFCVIMNRKKSTCFIATYMYVFLEGENYHWEQRSHEYNSTGNIFGFSDETSDWKLNLKHYPWKFHIHFFLLPATVSFVTIFFGIWPNYCFTESVIFSSIIGIFTLVILVLFYKNTFDYGKSKREMIAKWTALKIAESAKSNNAG